MEDTKFVIYINGLRTEYFKCDEEEIKAVTVAIINDTLGFCNSED